MNGENQETITIGMVLSNRYRILRLLGAGGMALVYLAKDLQNERLVAIKVLKNDLSNDEEFVRRFDAEAKAASSLSHPNIVRVLGVGEEHGIKYMVQEYVEGTSLKDLIDQYGRLDWHVAVPIGIQIALALEHAHKAGIVHRDIKPHNIMITPDRRALVTDFGIARATTANTITLTSGNAMGSVHYFSPEQARGGMVGPSADIYSLGILFYEMLTGDVPFDGETSVAVAIKHLQEKPADPRTRVPDLPAGLCAIVMKCIQKNPRQRYGSARELIDELDAFLLNPDGEYGVVEEDFNPNDPTTSIGTLRPENNYSKVQELEQSIQERRRSRRRENGVLIAMILIFSALLIGLGVFVISRISGGMNTQTTQETDYVLQDFTNDSLEDAVAELKKYGITPTVKQEASTEVASGYIIRQEPDSGTAISNGGVTTVTFWVSQGSDSLKLANYIGQNYLTVQRTLINDFGYTVNIEQEYNDDFKADLVIRTDPEAGELPQNDTVTLYVSQGPSLVTIPETLVGREKSVVLEELKNLGLTIGNSTVPYGKTIDSDGLYLYSTNPAVGTQVAKGTVVDLVFVDYEYFHPTTTTTTVAPTTTQATTAPTTTESTTAPTTTPSATTTQPPTETTTTTQPTAAPTEAPVTPEGDGGQEPQPVTP
ncbi:Stk1 family PASTA domain-containing Ser/Thr kinase [Oscillospiraceae bacterium HV4-5-C5C]|nr:Stk1 family PASTA domain-containing Ser/Thr kinase [Oscillospiraceae bacterium HV4-5-C5C]